MHPLGFGEILVIFLIVLVFWGPRRLSGLGKGIGDGIRNFKQSLRGEDSPKPPEDQRDLKR